MKHWLALAERSSLGPSHTFQHTEFVFQAGDAARNVYVLTRGVVEIIHLLEDGRSLIVKLLVGPTFFGLLECFGQEPKYLESVRALGAVEANEISVDRFRALVGKDAALALETLHDTCQTFCQTARAEPGRVFDTDALLANLLLSYGELFGKETREGVRLEMARTQADFANSVGASERQVQRLLTTWKRDGIVTKNEGSYVLKDVELLEEVAGPLLGSLIHRYKGPPT